jgi:hypothetical protein
MAISNGAMLAMLALPGARPEYALDALVELCNHLTVPLPLRGGTVAGAWNLRGGPSKETATVGDFRDGDPVSVFGQVANPQGETWLLVRSADARQAGWLFATALDA